MATGGQNAKPAEVLKLHGSYREDRHGSRGPKTGGEPLRKPDDLDPVASAHWDFMVRTRTAWLAASDADTLRRLCELWSLSEASRKQAMETPLVKDVRCAFTSYHAEWSKLAARFGMTPADRARLGEGADVHDKKDELEDMLG